MASLDKGLGRLVGPRVLGFPSPNFVPPFFLRCPPPPAELLRGTDQGLTPCPP